MRTGSETGLLAHIGILEEIITINLLHYVSYFTSQQFMPGYLYIVGNDLAGPLTVNILVKIKIVNRVCRVQKLNYVIMH